MNKFAGEVEVSESGRKLGAKRPRSQFDPFKVLELLCTVGDVQVYSKKTGLSGEPVTFQVNGDDNQPVAGYETDPEILMVNFAAKVILYLENRTNLTGKNTRVALAIFEEILNYPSMQEKLSERLNELGLPGTSDMHLSEIIESTVGELKKRLGYDSSKPHPPAKKPERSTSKTPPRSHEPRR